MNSAGCVWKGFWDTEECGASDITRVLPGERGWPDQPYCSTHELALSESEAGR